MTDSNKDPEEWKEIIGNKRHKEEMAKKFKDNDSPFKIAIVVDMWLTGFDVPSLATMYVYKPMKGYNLMQAIARVNRVFEDKEGGLVVDYVGIASALKEAMNDYTTRDKKNYGDTDVAKVAYPKFLEKLSICQDFFHKYDYSKFITGTDLERSKAISGGVNFIVDIGKEEEKTEFLKEALLLKQSLSLCSSMVEESLRVEAAFFESVRVLVTRLMNQGQGKKISLPEMNARINELLKASIKSDGVINLFSDVSQNFSLFDPKFLEEISKMKEKNLAVELLKKLIAEQVYVYRRTNVVKSEKFSEIIQSVMNRYLNGMLTNEQVIEELLNLAEQITVASKEGEKLGLTADELAFYDALTKPQAIKDFYENEELIAITKELADTLRKNRTIDWQKRDSARAKMRMMIKRLLKKHKYPPEGMDDAVQTVMTQCELWTDNNDMERENEQNEKAKKVKKYDTDNATEGLLVAEDSASYADKLSEDEIIYEIQKHGFSQNDANKIFSVLNQYNNCVDDKYFKKVVSFGSERNSTKYIGYMIPIKETSYYCINIKKKTLELLLLLANKFTPLGIVSDVLKFMNTFKFELEPEEVCIYAYIKEMNKKSKIILINNLIDEIKKNLGVCNEDKYLCKYADEGKCILNENNINAVLDVLQRKNVIKRYSTWIELVEEL